MRHLRKRTNGPPLPPVEMRKLVGPTDDASFDNPDGGLVFPYLPAHVYRQVFDFGCGCGRVARQMILQHEPPERYVGVDLHRGMIKWCQEKLTAYAPNFEFVHHDVFNYHFNPDPSALDALLFPVDDNCATLVNAYSVFTHLTQTQAEFYLAEASRVLAPDGIFHSTWFLFDRCDFPMLQRGSAALYVSFEDPSAAVLFDREWLRRTAARAGLVITSVIRPEFRGYQWVIVMEHERKGLIEESIPEDTAPRGEITLPDVPPDPSRIGLR